MKIEIKKNKIPILLFLIVLSLINCSEKNPNGENQIYGRTPIKYIDSALYPNSKKNKNDDKPSTDHNLSISVGTKKDFEKVLIGLDNEKGVPYGFDEDIYGYIIEGFDVDEQGKYYFLAGDNPSVLTCFSGNKEIFRKSYVQFMGNAIHAFKDRLLIFDYKYNANNLYVLAKNDGIILKSYQRIIENAVNNYHFLDSSLVIRAFNLEQQIILDTELAYLEYDFEGGMIGAAENLYKLPGNINTIAIYKEFMGYWRDRLVFFEYDAPDLDNLFFIFSLEDKNGKVLGKKIYNSDIFGESIYGLQGYPQEHRKLKNDNIYILAREDRNAVITILPLTKLFEIL